MSCGLDENLVSNILEFGVVQLKLGLLGRKGRSWMKGLLAAILSDMNKGPVDIKFNNPTNRIIFETNTVKFFEDVMVQRGNTNQIVFEESQDSSIQEAPTSVPIIIRISRDSLVQNPVVNEPIVNEPLEIEENPEQNNVDVEEESIPPQESQEAVSLRRYTRD
jgi:hypothetical protein